MNVPRLGFHDGLEKHARAIGSSPNFIPASRQNQPVELRSHWQGNNHLVQIVGLRDGCSRGGPSRWIVQSLSGNFWMRVFTCLRS
jgi:hypothetical protein